MIVMITVIPIIIQFTIFSFLLVSFIDKGAFGLAKLDQPCWLGHLNHIK